MMLLKPLVFAASAVAILLVPEVTESDEGIFRTLPIETENLEIPPSALGQSVDLPCRQCRGRDAHLQLDFAVEDGTRLTLNGFELYPKADPWHGDLTAAVIRGSGVHRERRLGYSLAVNPEEMDEDQGFGLIAVDLRIIEVGTRFVDDVPPVKIKLIQAPTGDIMIASVNVMGNDDGDKKTCDSMLCRIEGMFDHTWKKVKGGFKGCGGMRGHHKGKGNGHHKHPQKPEHRKGPKIADDKPHGGSEHKHQDLRHHSWSELIENVTSYVLLPVILGITAGVGVAMYVTKLHLTLCRMLTVSSLAMFLGSIAFRFARFLKGEAEEPSLGESFKAAATEVMADDAEKSGLMEHQDPPPQYEDRN